MTDAIFHPGLQQQLSAHRRLLRLLTLSIFLVMAGAMVFAMTMALQGGTLGDLLLLALIGGIVLVMVLSLGGLSWFLDRWMMRRLTDANRLVQEHRPLAARLTPTDDNTRPGTLMAVQLLDQPMISGSGHVLLKPSMGWGRPPPQDLTVQLYCQDLQPGSRLVALHDNKALLGKSVDRQQYLRQQQWMVMALAAVVLLVAITIFLKMLSS